MTYARVRELKESPFAKIYSPELYWESRRIRGLAEKALKALKSGRGVWVNGAPGSGRQSFIQHLAAKAAAQGLPVAVIDTAPTADGEAFIEALLCRLSDKQPLPPTHIEKCESLYAVLLDGLWRGGSVLCLTEPTPLVGSALKEAEILVALQVLEQPLASFVLCGEGSAPLPEMTTLEFPPYTAEELGRVLNHRLVMSSNAGLMETPAATAIVAAATGLSDLMERGEAALEMHLGKSSDADSGPVGAAAENAGGKPPRDIFAPDEIARLGKLLKDI